MLGHKLDGWRFKKSTSEIGRKWNSEIIRNAKSDFQTECLIVALD